MFSLSEIEEVCGVTLDAVKDTAKQVLNLADGSMVFTVSTSAALCSATARYLADKPCVFKGMNEYRQPVYRVDSTL